jgi:hypothetical protein
MAVRSTLIPRLLLLALAGGIGNLCLAQNLDMRGTDGAASSGRPVSGSTQASVEAAFGAPVTIIAPVGDPPIARWEYADFIVYFEYDRVIQAVRNRRAG